MANSSRTYLDRSLVHMGGQFARYSQPSLHTPHFPSSRRILQLSPPMLRHKTVGSLPPFRCRKVQHIDGIVSA